MCEDLYNGCLVGTLWDFPYEVYNTSIFVYILLFTLIHQFSGDGGIPGVLRILLTICIFPTLMLGVLMILAAFRQKWALKPALVLCGLLGICDISVGLFGTVYYLGKWAYTLNLAIAFLFLYLTCIGIFILICDLWRIHVLQKDNTTQ